MHPVIVGVIIRLDPATIAEEHSFEATAWQASCKPIIEAEQPVLMVMLIKIFKHFGHEVSPKIKENISLTLVPEDHIDMKFD
jgi:hypothetical protein